MTDIPRAAPNGFTLFELAIVIAIIALVTGMAVTSGVGVVTTARLAATQNKMKVIEDALMAFRSTNDRLPCPGNLTIAPGAPNYGVEAANPGSCTGGTPAANYSATGATNTTATGVEGAVPTATLGLPNDFIMDGWGNKIRYAVDASVTASSAFSRTSLGCPSAGAITVKDRNGTARSSGAIYALVSHGPNGHGAYTPKDVIYNAGSSSADELTNCHCTTAGVYSSYAPNYVQKSPEYDAGQTGNAAYYFDDVVSYKERWQMASDLDTVNCSYIYVTDRSLGQVLTFSPSGKLVASFSTTGNPMSVAVDASGNIYVSEWDYNRVEKFSSAGSHLMYFGGGYNGVAGAPNAPGSGNGQLNSPYGVAVDTAGNVWVADNTNNRIQEYSSGGSYLLGIGAGYQGVSGSIGSTGTASGKFNGPSDVAIDSSGNVWVTDWGNARVQKFNSSGTFLLGIGSGYQGAAGSIGSAGSATGQFAYPNGIAIDSSGNAWVTDLYNARTQKFSSTGAYLQMAGTGANGAANGQLNQPVYPATDSAGNVWIVDQANNRVEEFSSSGSYVSKFGTPAQLPLPSGIAIGR